MLTLDRALSYMNIVCILTFAFLNVDVFSLHLRLGLARVSCLEVFGEKLCLLECID